MPDPNDAYFKDKTPEYQGGIKSMYDRGIHITSYEEQGGDGVSVGTSVLGGS